MRQETETEKEAKFKSKKEIKMIQRVWEKVINIADRQRRTNIWIYGSLGGKRK